MTIHTDLELLDTREGDCGCAEEAWRVNGIDLDLHVEPTGEIHAFMDGGDWGEAERTFAPGHPDGVRAAALVWAIGMTNGPEL